VSTTDRQKLSVRDLALEGKRVFLRVDLNVPLEGGKVSDDTRIRAALPSIQWILERGGHPILASHLGRPEGSFKPALSLAPVARSLATLLGREVIFASNCVGQEAVEEAARLRQGELLLLENLRFHPGEEKNDPDFAHELASLAEIYVNDAFGTAHRAHASVEAICRHFPAAAAGLLMEREIYYLGQLLGSPPRPYVAILGGSKVSDKVALVNNLLPKVDVFLIGGAMAYTFLAARQVPVGNSRVEKERVLLAGEILGEAEKRGVRILLPSDHRVSSAIDNYLEVETTGGPAIPPGRVGLDLGPSTVGLFSATISTSGTVLWNGPVGLFEHPPFDEGSRRVAESVASSRALSVAGGGDTAAALARFGLSDRFTHVSTGGGATLEFLAGMDLPGITALTDRS